MTVPPFTYLLVCRGCLFTAFLEDVLNGSLAYIPSTKIRNKLGNPLEWHTLPHIEVGNKRPEVVAIFDTAIGSIAVVHTATLAHLLLILFLGRLHDKLDVHNLGLADFPVIYISKRPAAALAAFRLMPYNPVWSRDCLLSTTLVA